MSGTTAVTIICSIIGSSAIFGFIQFLISRKDKKREQIDEFHSSMNEQLAGIKTDISGVKDDILEVRDDMIEMQNQFRESIAALDDKIEKDIAIQARIRILRASDEMRQNVHHSYEYFRQLNRDITVYMNYCGRNTEFKNNEATSAIEHINRVYQDCLDNNNFLS